MKIAIKKIPKGNLSSHNYYRCLELLLRKYDELKKIRDESKKIPENKRPSYIKERVEKMVNELKFPPIWVRYISQFIETSKISVPVEDIDIHTDYSRNEIAVFVNKNTTKEDYFKVWDEVKKLQPILKPTHKPTKILVRDFLSNFLYKYGDYSLKELLTLFADDPILRSITEEESLRKGFFKTKKKLSKELS